MGHAPPPLPPLVRRYLYAGLPDDGDEGAGGAAAAAARAGGGGAQPRRA